jgi:hypothetical protein
VLEDFNKPFFDGTLGVYPHRKLHLNIKATAKMAEQEAAETITYLLHNLTRLPVAPNPTIECACQSYSQYDNREKIIGCLKGNIDDCVAQSFSHI